MLPILQILLLQILKKKFPCRNPDCSAVWKNPPVLRVLLLLTVLPVACKAIKHQTRLYSLLSPSCFPAPTAQPWEGAEIRGEPQNTQGLKRAVISCR